MKHIFGLTLITKNHVRNTLRGNWPDYILWHEILTVRLFRNWLVLWHLVKR